MNIDLLKMQLEAADLIQLPSRIDAWPKSAREFHAYLKEELAAGEDVTLVRLKLKPVELAVIRRLLERENVTVHGRAPDTADVSDVVVKKLRWPDENDSLRLSDEQVVSEVRFKVDESALAHHVKCRIEITLARPQEWAVAVAYSGLPSDFIFSIWDDMRRELVSLLWADIGLRVANANFGEMLEQPREFRMTLVRVSGH